MFGFKNSNIYIEGKGIIKSNLQIKDKKFFSFDYLEELDELDDKYIIVPGFIDEHIHGSNNSDTMDATKTALDNISTSIIKEGVTSFLATTMTMKKEKILSSLENIANYNNENGANLLGIHLEGPFISTNFSGAQNKDEIIKPTKELLKEYINKSKNKIKIVTLAPENCNEEIYQILKDNNIVISAGHTNATAKEIKDAINHGLSLTTHTYNAMKGIHHREIGTVGAALLYDELASELICDLHHVSEDAIRLLYKNKPKDKLILITDSMEAKFLNDGNYSLGGRPVIVKNGTARLENDTLAGSILHMNDAIRNLMKVCNTTLEEAIDKATINPAINLKIANNKGSINIGKDADFVIIDKDLNIYRTYVNGKLIYKKD